MSLLIQPHGGKLIDLFVEEQEKQKIKQESTEYLSLDLTARQICDLELLANGGFSPLQGFMDEKDYNNVVKNMRLADGTLWPMPITLDVKSAFAEKLSTGQKIVLRDPEGVALALLDISDIYTPDKQKEAELVFGADDKAHPAVSYLYESAGDVYLGGKITALDIVSHYDFREHRHTPKEIRALFDKRGWRNIIAFQTRNPMHRAHVELTFRAARQVEANLLLHPVVGMTKPGDVDHYTRVRCYERVVEKYPHQTTMLSLLPLAMRMAGPREALWHAIIRKNHGCNHFIIGRDHAGPGKNSQGEPFYDPYAAQELVKQHTEELGMTIVPFEEMVYIPERGGYAPVSEVTENETKLALSGTEFRRRLQEDIEIPDWFSYPEIIQELKRTYPPRAKQGFTIFFTGLSGAGKSSIANALLVKLLEMGGRRVTLLDGDITRKHLSSELGFSKEHRDLNILRIGYVASEITKHGGIAICANIAPYAGIRNAVREMVSAGGGFIEVHVATSLEVCESRDRKGLYQKARQGIIKGFTGIDDPYEMPENPEVSIDTSDCTADQAAQSVLLKLESLGYIVYEK